MSLPTLASSGNVVKIWNNLNYAKQLTPVDDTKERVTSIAWSPNGKYIVSCSNKGDKIVVTEVGCPTRFISLTPKEVNTCVSYSSTKNIRFLSCGQSSSVSIWDIKSRSIVKSVKTSLDGNLITCAAFDARDSYIACGMKSGAVFTISTTSTLAHSPMVYPKVMAITDIKFSYKKKNLFGTSSDDGGCNLWDAYENKRIHSFDNSHSAPATGFSFSPVNEILLATVGYDKAVKFYDSRSRKFISKISTEEPLSCLDFTNDGKYIAVGSTKGSIFAYDLRTTSAPLRTIDNAHSGPVSAVLFQDVTNVGDDYVMDATMKEFSLQKSENKANSNINLAPHSKWQASSQPADNMARPPVNQTALNANGNASIRTAAGARAAQTSSLNVSTTLETSQLQPQSPSRYVISDSQLNPANISQTSWINSSADGTVNDTMNSQSILNSSQDINQVSQTKVDCPVDVTPINHSMDESASERPSCLREIVHDELKEFQKAIQNDISQLHIYCVRQFINCETAIEGCVKKLDSLDAKLTAVREDLRKQRNGGYQ